MAPQSMPGKASRVYRSELRQQQAEQTRSRILAAAAELFAADGYSGTTLTKIAAAAGVSVETVQGHGPKAALLTAAAEYAAFGVTGEGNILNLDVGRKLLAIDDREEALDFLAAAQADIHQRTARLVQTLSAAASSDPKLDRYLSDVIASINLQTRRILAAYRDRGWLRDDVPFDELVETSAVLCSTETFLRIVHRDGWSAEAYRAWCRRTLAETVFLPPQAD